MNESKHRGEVLSHVEGCDVIACDHCGFAHIDPLPTAEELEKFYKEAFYTDERPAYLDNATEDAKWIKHTADNKYRIFESLLDDSRRTLLDVGCGPGFFLDAGVDRGWNVAGVEPSPVAAQFVKDRGLRVSNCMFDEAFASEHKGSFDVLHMCNVLEHVRDASQLIESSQRVLKPGGVICITSPNDFNPIQRALVDVQGFSPWWVVPRHHINYFNFDSLTALITRHGFENKKREASFPLDLFLLMGDNYIGDGKLGRQIHHKRVALEMGLANTPYESVRQDLYDAFANLGLGRLATVYGQLPD